MKGTIKSKQEIERLFKKGRRFSCFYCSILVLDSPSQFKSGRCAFIAGKKLGNAPFRNRCKRVLRNVVFELGGSIKNKDIVYIAKQSIAYAKHDKVKEQVRKMLKHVESR